MYLLIITVKRQQKSLYELAVIMSMVLVDKLMIITTCFDISTSSFVCQKREAIRRKLFLFKF